jgi:hypothetical protein
MRAATTARRTRFLASPLRPGVAPALGQPVHPHAPAPRARTTAKSSARTTTRSTATPGSTCPTGPVVIDTPDMGEPLLDARPARCLDQPLRLCRPPHHRQQARSARWSMGPAWQWRRARRHFAGDRGARPGRVAHRPPSWSRTHRAMSICVRDAAGARDADRAGRHDAALRVDTQLDGRSTGVPAPGALPRHRRRGAALRNPDVPAASPCSGLQRSRRPSRPRCLPFLSDCALETSPTTLAAAGRYRCW